ncbi:hypothetical protein SNOG_06944 [Parastagonospora nodorum SN15]|uniref:Uncharacterized protein n=1 Tax=Phaeosphaeria nodorum (strain SN15 / ATCC MYA-4574 / FGSC 10173) TaxID=321614 RepID=Q0UMS0_PHANO|nr:hypothetical protein SNOG_06944 [Parastagonospora nodorum SN15]EAT85595.1 hypothetical protein SNOG_06944 [Parastagonospora nodorum SN15]
MAFTRSATSLYGALSASSGWCPNGFTRSTLETVDHRPLKFYLFILPSLF